MRILLTRPRAQAEESARRLRACGHEVLIAPMLEIVPLAPSESAPDTVAAVLFTSANGIRYGASLVRDRALPVFCVGGRTAAAARAEGFANVESADGDAAALAALLSRRFDPAAGTLLHLCGRERKPALRARLEAAGFTLAERPVYAAELAEALPAESCRALEEGDIDLLLVYSARSARRFAELAPAAVGTERLAGLTAGALSSAAAAPLEDVIGRVVVAPEPQELSLMAALAEATGEPFPRERTGA